MAKTKAAAKAQNKRKVVDEETAPSQPASGSEQDDKSVVLAEPSGKSVLDTAQIKRFKSHANYNSTKEGASVLERQFANKALELYQNGTSEQKQRILDSFRSDKTYKWANTFVEETVDAVSDKDKFASGWMTKYDLAKALNIPSHDPALFEELCSAAVEGVESKPHANPGLAAKGLLLYNMPVFRLGGHFHEHASTTQKSVRGETDVTANHLKKVADGEEVKIKIEHPEWVAMQAAAKLIDKGHKLMIKSLNAGRTTAAKVKLFLRNESKDACAAIGDQLDAFHHRMVTLDNFELDVMTLLQLCKEVDKDDKESIAVLKGRSENVMVNGKAAVQEFDALRDRTAKLI